MQLGFTGGALGYAPDDQVASETATFYACAGCVTVSAACTGSLVAPSPEAYLELCFEDAPAPEVTDVITAPVEIRVA